MAPDAAQDVAFVDDHVSVVDCPAVIVVGFAERVAVGAETDGEDEVRLTKKFPLTAETPLASTIFMLFGRPLRAPLVWDQTYEQMLALAHPRALDERFDTIKPMSEPFTGP